MDLLQVAHSYVDKILKQAGGLKVLLLDEETTAILSCVFSMSELLEREVFLVDRVDNTGREEAAGFTCISFLRPTGKSVEALCKELAAPKYQSYFLFFSNSLRRSFLEKIAESDFHERICQLHEAFLDFQALTPSLFTLGVQSSHAASCNQWRLQALRETVDGLSSVFLSLGLDPIVRFDKSSPMAYRLAEEMCGLSERHAGLEPCTLLLLDRRSDLLTPLLTHWSYLSMLAEQLDFRNGRVLLPDKREFSLLPLLDPFYLRHVHSTFGALGDAVSELAADFRRLAPGYSGGDGRVPSVKEMREFVQRFPEHRKKSQLVAKHVSLLEALSKEVAGKRLFRKSELEQSIAVASDSREAVGHFDSLLQLLREELQQPERLRLLSLFFVAYRRFLPAESVLLQRCLARMGKELSPAELSSFLEFTEYESFSQDSSGFFVKAKGLSAAKETVYTQHKCRMHPIAESLVRSSLPESQYPTFRSPGSQMAPRKHVVFVIGGMSAEESKALQEIDAGKSLLIGGGSEFSFSKSLFREISLFMGSREQPSSE